MQCSIRIGASRPPTHLGDVQGRHTSAYSLMLCVIKNRLEEQSVQDAGDILKNLIKEYIADNKELEQFFQKDFEDIIKKYGKNTEDYKKRLSIYKADKATAEFLSPTTIDFMRKLPKTEDGEEVLKSFEKMLVAHQERNAVSAMDIRNMMKRSQEAYKPFVSDLLALTILIFNRTLDATKRFSQPEKKSKSRNSSSASSSDSTASADNSVENTAETSALKNLGGGMDKYKPPLKESAKAEERLKYIELTKDVSRKIAQDIAALFDYKYDLVFKEACDQAETNKTPIDYSAVESQLFKLMRRHIKMSFDAFPFLQILMKDEEDRKHIIDDFAAQILEKEGWKKAFEWQKKTFENASTLSNAVLAEKIGFTLGDEGTLVCTIEDKSEVKKRHGDMSKKLDDSRGGEYPSFSNVGDSFLKLEDDSEDMSEPEFDLISDSKLVGTSTPQKEASTPTSSPSSSSAKAITNNIKKLELGS